MHWQAQDSLNIRGKENRIHHHLSFLQEHSTLSTLEQWTDYASCFSPVFSGIVCGEQQTMGLGM